MKTLELEEEEGSSSTHTLMYPGEYDRLEFAIKLDFLRYHSQRLSKLPPLERRYLQRDLQLLFSIASRLLTKSGSSVHSSKRREAYGRDKGFHCHGGDHNYARISSRTGDLQAARKVSDKNGRPLRAEVYLSKSGVITQKTWTETKTGYYEFPVLPGTYDILANAESVSLGGMARGGFSRHESRPEAGNRASTPASTKSG